MSATTSVRPSPDTPPPAGRSPLRRPGLTGAQLAAAIPAAARKLSPVHLWRSPVMFIVWLGSVVTTIAAVATPGPFTIAIAIWLWLTVFFGNLAEAGAEGRSKAQAASLRAARTETPARKIIGAADSDQEEEVSSSSLVLGDLVPRHRRSGGPRGRRSDRRRGQRSTSRPSPASPPRSSAKPAATGQRSPAAPPCCPTRSSSGSPPRPESPSWTR